MRGLLRNIPVRVAAGTNRGRNISVTAGKHYISGDFEPERVAFIASLIRPGECFWDIGAHRGYITLAAAGRVGEDGHVFSFEPSPKNLWYLRKHVQWNHLDNVRIVPAAISDHDGQSRFEGSGSLGARLGDGAETVAVRSVASLIESGECIRPTFLKIDVEGAEVDLLRGAAEYLRDPGILMLVATHSSDRHEECLAFLKETGYRTHEAAAVNVVRESGWDSLGDVDILAIGPACSVSDAEVRFFTERC